MNATAVFLEPANNLEAPQLQPLPNASEAAWDRWMLEVSGADFLSWRAALRQSAPASAIERPLRAVLSDD
jgi:hypothetical protein